MIELTEQQRHNLSEPETEVVDPITRETYVLIRKEVFDRLRNLVDDDVLATAEMVDQIMAEDDANDPYLESYQSMLDEDKP